MTFSESGRPFPESEMSESKYSLDRVKIEPTKALQLPEQLRRFDWPQELNGSGRTNRERKEMTIKYPTGDRLLSYVTTIHELGHLRQHELNPKLQDNEIQTHENLVAEEEDAWSRGWERFRLTNPERLAEFEVIVDSTDNETLREMGSFQGLYEYVRGESLRIVEMQNVLFDGKEQGFERLASQMEQQGIPEYFLKFMSARTEKIISIEEIESDIKKVVQGVIRE